jgi:Na+-translocating ferredoxin:NAD+ oxidoreductase RnfD subunit
MNRKKFFWRKTRNMARVWAPSAILAGLLVLAARQIDWFVIIAVIVAFVFVATIGLVTRRPNDYRPKSHK